MPSSESLQAIKVTTWGSSKSARPHQLPTDRAGSSRSHSVGPLVASGEARHSARGGAAGQSAKSRQTLEFVRSERLLRCSALFREAAPGRAANQDSGGYKTARKMPAQTVLVYEVQRARGQRSASWSFGGPRYCRTRDLWPLRRRSRSMRRPRSPQCGYRGPEAASPKLVLVRVGLLRPESNGFTICFNRVPKCREAC